MSIQNGYRHIDCAAIYGNEKEIGEALKEIFDSGIVKREDLWITSKLWSTQHRPEDVHVALTQTLKDLQLDYLDLYLIHWPLSWKRGEGIDSIKGQDGIPVHDSVPTYLTWQAMEEEVSAKRVRNIGLSNYMTCHMIDVWSGAKIKPAVNQVECHPYLNQAGLIDAARRFNVIVEAYSPLGTGSRDLIEDEKVVNIAKKHKTSVACVLLRFHIQRGVPVLTKSVNEAHIKDNLNCLKFSLDNSDMDTLMSLNSNFRYCNPAIFGIDSFS